MDILKSASEEVESLAEMLNDCSIDQLMAIDKDWQIIAWNKTSELVSHRSKSVVLGKNLLEVFPQIEEDEEMMRAIHSAFAGFKNFLPAHRHNLTGITLKIISFLSETKKITLLV